MAEETKENQSSQQTVSEAEKKPTVPAAVQSSPATAPRAAPPTPRPGPVAPRPQSPPPATTSKPQQPKDSGRRKFLKAALAVGAILSIVPYVPWGTFLSSSVSTGTAKRYLLQKARVDQNTKYGVASGQLVNVNDLTTFPANGHWVITYPTSGDPTLDSQNPDTFLKYELIRLPTELGGNGKKATDFVAFSKVCVHLWCSPNYNPTQTKNPNENGYQAPGPNTITHQQYECPCHGSIYEIPDGKAVAGPASLQAFPTNAIPMLTLQADSNGQLYVFFPNRDPSKPFPLDGVDAVAANGELGFGRDYTSYTNFIKPAGQTPADLKNLTQEVKG
ncbi:MAG: Rieske 2Fe-2S domain-containing protein [Thaumarchaeota archaeon]|nr:Rieske 2Fe-2S domain-containing protein [Nitrososphaerota archaeon]